MEELITYLQQTHTQQATAIFNFHNQQNQRTFLAASTIQTPPLKNPETLALFCSDELINNWKDSHNDNNKLRQELKQFSEQFINTMQACKQQQALQELLNEPIENYQVKAIQTCLKQALPHTSINNEPPQPIAATWFAENSYNNQKYYAIALHYYNPERKQ